MAIGNAGARGHQPGGWRRLAEAQGDGYGRAGGVSERPEKSVDKGGGDGRAVPDG